jgi:hypothetical protein
VLRSLSLALLGAATLAVLAPQAGAYRAVGPKWPGGVITYFDDAPDQAWALDQAVSAWNRSGALVRFVPATRDQAAVVVEHSDDPTIAACRKAEASVGHVRHARVFIFRRDDSSLFCNRWNAAFFLAHELGHVLGLAHETHTCATMNPVGNMEGGSQCADRNAWEWFCRLLEPDDVAGAVALYGGAPAPMRGPPDCPLYRSQRPPAVKLTWHAAERAVELTVTGASAPAYVQFLAASVSGKPTGFGYAGALGACPSATARAAAPNFAYQDGNRWDGTIAVDPPPGRYCYLSWSVDALGRRSAKIAQRIIVVPPRPSG